MQAQTLYVPYSDATPLITVPVIGAKRVDPTLRCVLINVVTLQVDRSNFGSQRLLDKLGFDLCFRAHHTRRDAVELSHSHRRCIGAVQPEREFLSDPHSPRNIARRAVHIQATLA